jgi:hypothetical protein
MIVGLIWRVRPAAIAPKSLSKRALIVVIAFVIAWFVGGLLSTLPQNQPHHDPSSPEHADMESSSS